MEKNVLRNKSIGTKVSDEELSQLEKLAEARGLTLSEWLRELALAELIAHPAEQIILAEILALRMLYLNTGKERDSETGLDYFGARYYSNALARFTSADTKRIALRHLLNPQKLNKYAYVLNNPLSEFDPDGLEDIKVFVHFTQGETMPQNQPNWSKIQSTAVAHGNTVTVFQGDAANEKNFQSSLSSGGTTVFIGHSQMVDNGQGPQTVAISLADKEIGQPSNDPNVMGAGRPGPNPDVVGSIDNPGVLPNVSSSSSVALFGCDTDQLAGQYSGAASFVGVDSPNHVTSTDGLLSAGGAFVSDLAAGKSTSTAVNDANKNIHKDPKVDAGSKVVLRTKEQQQ
jgi:RHS repeat-associated protein